MRDKKVLGIFSDEDEGEDTSSGTAEVIETGSGEYVGKIKTPDKAGNYEIFARIVDVNGNVEEKKITDLRVSEGFLVKDNRGAPIEKAQVLFYYYNKRNRLYEILPPQIFPIKNPVYTDRYGRITVSLPIGKYKARVTAIGYESAEVKFEIHGGSNADYPEVVLKKSPFNIITAVIYYWNILIDFFSSSKSFVKKLSDSVRFHRLNAAVTTTILIILSFIGLSSRMRVPIWSIPYFLIHKSKLKNAQDQLISSIKGRVVDKNKNGPIQGADVYLLDKNNNVLNHTRTGSDGKFSIDTHKEHKYSVQIVNEGYGEISLQSSQFTSSSVKEIDLGSRKHQNLYYFRNLDSIAREFFSVLFEALLLISFGFEISLGYSLGWLRVLPFILISTLNLGIWLVHLSNTRET